MRITGGRYVRRIVEVPKGIIRPAMDRMRVSVFAALGDLTGCSFLDLFSGSGILGIEAASRGADPVVLVEADRGKRETILRNCRIVDGTIALKIMSAERYIASAPTRFDVVFLDPPFDYRDKQSLVGRVGARGLVAAGGRLLIHHSARERLADRDGNLERYDERSYGGSLVEFFRIGAS